MPLEGALPALTATRHHDHNSGARQARRAADGSPELAAARAAAEARRAAAIAENARWLAHSDHRPIRVTAAATTAASAPVAAG